MHSYIVATIKPWNIKAYHAHTKSLPGKWHLITEKEELTPDLITRINPRYIFFPHWSWMVSQSVLDATECVCFHMTDVPYGRGGSPLQNLIVSGHKTTKLTALKMASEFDAGPVYKKLDLSLAGSAQAIYEQAARLCYKLIKYIIENTPEPVPQVGEVTAFERRTPEQSEFNGELKVEQLYDLIRMLDAESYPHAFSILNDYRLEFANAELCDDEVTATVTFNRITKANE